MENPIKMDDLGVPLFLETPTQLPEEHLSKLLAKFALGQERLVLQEDLAALKYINLRLDSYPMQYPWDDCIFTIIYLQWLVDFCGKWV